MASSPVRDLLALINQPETISFAGGLPAPELFDVDGWRAAFDRALTGADARRNLQYAPTEGNLALRTRIATLRTEYRTRRDTMIATLPTATPDGTQWTDPDGGMFIWLRLPGDVDTATILRTALRHQVAFVPGASFFATTPDHATMRLSFTTTTPAAIEEGIRRLATCLTP